MMSICEWGHARLVLEEDINDFDDQDHMDFVGEFSFSVNETCLSCDYNIFFMVAPTDTDAHNLLLVHLHPSDMNWKEKHSYVSSSQEDATKGKKDGYSEVEQAQGSRLW